MRKCIDTEWCLILNFFENRPRRIAFSTNLNSIFFIVTSNLKNLMYRQSFLCQSSNILPQRKNFVDSGRKQYENPDSHDFCFFDAEKKNTFPTCVYHRDFFLCILLRPASVCACNYVS